MKQFSFLLFVVLFVSCSRNDKQLITKQYRDSLAKASLLKSEHSKERETETIYQSSSPQHNVVHEFTYLIAMQDFCNKTLSQMRVNDEVNKKFFKKLEKELLKSKTALTSSRFKGLKIESGLYEKFLNQINHQFKD